MDSQIMNVLQLKMLQNKFELNIYSSSFQSCAICKHSQKIILPLITI
jgi:hypothetical protein